MGNGTIGTASHPQSDGARPTNSGTSILPLEVLLTPNPIFRALSTLRTFRVRFLLMGGQACVLYGAAEFSRDADIAILAEPDNLQRLNDALRELEAECIALPPLSISYLRKGHAVHFRCRHPDARDLRIDIMSVMRGAPSFATLWRRRTTVTTEDGTTFDLISLPDLLRVKKTQRDKDWPMLRRLVEAHYVGNAQDPNADQIAFWFREARSPAMLIQLVEQYPDVLERESTKRPLLDLARDRRTDELEAALQKEEQLEREADRAYWLPLKKELEQLRHDRRKRRK